MSPKNSMPESNHIWAGTFCPHMLADRQMARKKEVNRFISDAFKSVAIVLCKNTNNIVFGLTAKHAPVAGCAAVRARLEMDIVI